MNTLPNETKLKIFVYLEKEVFKIMQLSKELNQLFNVGKSYIAYNIIKKYNSSIIYKDSYDIFTYITKNNLSFRLDFNLNKHLIISAKNGYLGIAKFLVENGAAVNARNSDGTSGLMIASQNGHLNVVKFLVENGAAVNARNNDGVSSFSLAAQNGNRSIVKCLVDNGGCY